MGPLGFQELIVIFVIALLVFGPKKLPELGKSLGKGIREFKKATDEMKSSWGDHVRDIEETSNDVKRDVQEAGKIIEDEDFPAPTVSQPQEPVLPKEETSSNAGKN